MAFAYVYPTLVSLPVGYDCAVPSTTSQIEARLEGRTANVRVRFRVFRAGRVERTDELIMRFEDGKLVGDPPSPVIVRDADRTSDDYGYLEVETDTPDETAVFSSQAVFGLYTIYSAPGRKSFLSDNAYKYGSPPVILQIAQFSKFVDTYPVVHVDRERDLGDTILLINPYKKAILGRIDTEDGRALPRLKVPSESVLPVRMADLLREDENMWRGQIQLQANNRLVTFIVKHSLGDPTVISDHEHLDPFRGDPTHAPITQRWRQKLGKSLKRWKRRAA